MKNSNGSQTAMVGTAKARLEAIEEQLHSARIDFEATQDAAQKAAASAQEAQNNAAEAAVHASIGLHESGSSSGSGGDGHTSGGGGGDDFASNHNYGEYKPVQQYSYAGY